MANFFADLFTGGAASRNEAAREANEAQKKNIKAAHDYNWGETQRQYKYAVEGLEIQKRNNEKNLQFQEAERTQQYNYGMGIRAYEHTQNNRVYDLTVSRALQQQSFNEIAENAALVDQDRLIHEQLLTLAFDETQTLFDYGAAAAGLGLQKRQAKAAAATEAQATRISALKATGAAQARGVSGRSAAMNVQGMLAEAGARQAAIIDELMFNTEATDQQLFKMNQQLLLDKAGFETSRESAMLTDTAARNKIKMQALQAAIEAEASIGLIPEIAPPLPKPYALPRPEYQDIYEPKEPPMTVVANPAQESLFAAGLSTVGSFALQAAPMVGAGLKGQGLGTGNFRGFNWGKAFGFA